jgi:hypothetical protein
MMPGKSKFAYRIINLAVSLLILLLCMEVLSLNISGHHRTILLIIHGVIVALLIISLILLRTIQRKDQNVETTAHSQEKTEMQRVADKAALRYRNLLECAGDAIFVINADTGRLEEMNSKGSELFGYSRAEMDRLNGRDLIPVRDQHLYTTLVRRIVRYGKAGEESITFKRQDGSRFLGEVNARLIDLGDEKVVQAIVRDITHKKQAEQDILRRNKKLSILNSIISRGNQAINFHLVLDKALQDTMELFGAESGVIHLLENESLILATQKDVSVPFVGKIGTDSPNFGIPCGMAAGMQCDTLLRGSGPVCEIASAARESGWQSVAGIPLFAGKRLYGVMHILAHAEREYIPEDIGFFTTMGNQIGIGIEHSRMFDELNWKSKELLRSHQLLEKNSLQLELSRKRLEKNLALVELANLELERLDKMKNHFIGMVSHEFRTPLTSILSGTEFLISNHATASSEVIQQLVEMIHGSGERLNEIITNLLKVVKLEANTSFVAKASISLREILDVVLEEYERFMEARGQKIILQEGMDALPFFCGDREYLEEIFRQLMANAIKFTPDGGEVYISAQVADRSTITNKKALLSRFNQHFYEQMGWKCYLQVEVRDSGIGIDPAEQLKIFDKFYEIGDIRHHSTGKHKFQGKGTGMGLAIVKGMVEAQGGMVWVESPATKTLERPGSVFKILLPLEEDIGQAEFHFMQKETPRRFSDPSGHKTFEEN